ncbi:DUF6368 family protein [Micromonospora sp. NPDC049799]|uniref:DUF6368 family protein n=1 Tax=Micromonospora sp. NPDC049799 TaxID=3154741 RepID=UPI0033E597BA
MAGPSLGLWLTEPLTLTQLTGTAVPWLRTFCRPVEVDADAVDFWVRDAGPLHLGPVDLDGVPLRLWIEREPWADGDDLAVLPQPPRQELGLYAGCNDILDHRVLGALALALARRLDALVDFDGLLATGGPSTTATLEETAGEARAVLGALPGRLWEVTYDMATGHRWAYHVGDAEFLAAWLRHPRFHLVS